VSWLRSLLRKRAPSPSRQLLIQFDRSGWIAESSKETYASWVNEFGDHLLLTLAEPPARTEAEMTQARRVLEASLERAGGSLLSLAVVDVAGQPALEAIMTYHRLPPANPDTSPTVEPWFVGRLRVMTPGGNAVLIEIQCEDRNPHWTGVRETAVATQLLREGARLDLDAGCVHGPTVGKGAAEERWDAEFPNHPLSRLRRHLRHCRETLSFPSEDGQA
jgi:hypothetical protein